MSCKCHSCSSWSGYSEELIEQRCRNTNCGEMDLGKGCPCACGFDEEFNPFPENPMFGQSYVPIQIMNKTFKPCVGLKMGTIFPELVSPYRPCQSMREIAFIEASNKIGEGCNR